MRHSLTVVVLFLAAFAFLRSANGQVTLSRIDLAAIGALAPKGRVQDRLRASVLQESKVAPQLTLRDLNGRTVRLSRYRGKVVVINFWATWCPPGRAEMPDLIKLQRDYAKDGLQIIGITYPPEEKARVRTFASSLKVNYPIVLGTREIKARFSSDETLPL